MTNELCGSAIPGFLKSAEGTTRHNGVMPVDDVEELALQEGGCSATFGAMAKHWVADRPGGIDVFSFEHYDAPRPGASEVSIQFRAAGMNPADAKHVARGNAQDFPRPIGYESRA